MELTRLIWNPNEFFSGNSQPTQLWKAFSIVFLSGAAQALPILVMLQRVLPSIPQSLEWIYLVGNAVGILGAVGGVVVTWLLVTAAVNGIAVYSGANTEYRETAVFVGWAFFPKILLGVTNAVILFFVLRGLTLPETLPAINQTMLSIRASPPILGVRLVLGIMIVLWSALICHEGLQAATDITSRRQLYAVAIPFGLLIIYRVANILRVLLL